MAQQPRLRRRIAFTAGGMLSVTLLIIFVFHEAFKEPVMNLAGFFIGSVNDNQSAFATVVVSSFALVWVAIGAICWLERARPED